MLADYKSSVSIRVESVLTKNSIEVIFFPLKTQVFLKYAKYAHLSI